MSRSYKFHNPEGIYFVSFATVFWIDLFIREIYFGVIENSLKYCIQHKSMILHAYCVMPSHIQMVFRSSKGEPSELLRDFKRHTSKALQKGIAQNPRESRKIWMLKMMKDAGKDKPCIRGRQLWQHHSHPIELWSNYLIDQKIDYVHDNPVKAGFVRKPEYWKYSSAEQYITGDGGLDIECIR